MLLPCPPLSNYGTTVSGIHGMRLVQEGSWNCWTHCQVQDVAGDIVKQNIGADEVASQNIIVRVTDGSTDGITDGIIDGIAEGHHAYILYP